MLAAVLHGPEDLKLEPIEDRPLAGDEVRLAFRAGGICGSDLSYYVDYPSREAIAEALSSPVRGRARAVTEEIVGLFAGRFYHVVGQRLGRA